MSRRNTLLERLTVSSPCDADWDSMNGNEQVRSCEHCRLSVNNLSAMTRKDAINLVMKSGGRICVRFYRRADGAVVTAGAQASERLHQIKRRATRIAAGAFSAALSLSPVGAASAATGRGASPSAEGGGATANSSFVSGVRAGTADAESVTTLNASVTGTILDPNGAVIPGARVTLLNNENGAGQATTSDDEGAFLFQSLSPGTYTLKVSANGFADASVTEISLQESEARRVDVSMNINLDGGEVTVTSVTTVTTATMGIVAISEPSEPLVLAASKNDLEAIRKLLSQGADVNVRDKGVDLRALDEAVVNANLEMVAALLRAGANVNAKSNSGLTALMRVSEEDEESEEGTKGRAAKLVKALLAAGADVNLKDDEGETALIHAASRENANVLRLLLRAGAEVDAADEEGRTALMAAADEGNINNVKVLVAAGANINLRDEADSTALKIAAEDDQAEVVEFLKSLGAVE